MMLTDGLRLGPFSINCHRRGTTAALFTFCLIRTKICALRSLKREATMHASRWLLIQTKPSRPGVCLELCKPIKCQLPGAHSLSFAFSILPAGSFRHTCSRVY